MLKYDHDVLLMMRVKLVADDDREDGADEVRVKLMESVSKSDFVSFHLEKMISSRFLNV